MKMRINIINTGTKRSINGGGGNSGITKGKAKSKIVSITIKINDLLQKYLNIKFFTE
ncbi:hypothetical protein PTKIN_Ptkin06aG0106400 [Pterospermum kingtungense]